MNSSLLVVDRGGSLILLTLSFYFQIPICIIGFILNVVNVFVLSHNIRHNSLYFVMSAVALTDAMTLILRAPQGLLREDCWPLCSNQEFRMYLYIYIIYVEVPVTNITENISSWLTLSLAIERYLAMRQHHFAKVYCTLKNFKTLVLTICSLATLMSLPYFFTYSISIKYELNNDTQVEQSALYTNETMFSKSSLYLYHSFFRQTMVQFLPLILMCIFSFLLFKIVYNHNKNLAKNPRFSLISQHCDKSPEAERLVQGGSTYYKKAPKEKPTIIYKKLRAQRNLTILLIVIISLFLIGQIPHAFAYIKLYEAIGYCSQYVFDCMGYQIFRTSTMVLTLICYSSNFFVHLLFNTPFRKTLLCAREEVHDEHGKNGKSLENIKLDRKACI